MIMAMPLGVFWVSVSLIKVTIALAGLFLVRTVVTLLLEIIFDRLLSYSRHSLFI